MTRQIRSAFTLVELLVVITIIGMLVALLLPAVNSARESARQTTCLNNQRNFGQAIQQFSTAKDRFPGYRERMTQSGVTGAPYAVINWQVVLMPYMERTDVYQALLSGAVGNSTTNTMKYWESSVCPSDNTVSGRSSPWTSYVSNSGMLDTVVPPASGYKTSAINIANPPNLPGPTLESKANGIFQDLIILPDGDARAKFTSSDIKDGQTTTLLISENLDVLYYQDPVVYTFSSTGNPPVPSGINGGARPNSTERGATMIWWDTSVGPSVASGAIPPPPPTNGPLGTYPQEAINAKKGDYNIQNTGWPSVGSGTDANNHAARPSSAHPTGVIVCFAGANTKFLREDIDYWVFCELMTPDGAHATTLSHSAAPVTSWQKYVPLDENKF